MCFSLMCLSLQQSQFMNETRSSLIRNAVPTIFNIQFPPKRLSSKRPPPKERHEPPVKRRKSGRYIFKLTLNKKQNLSPITLINTQLLYIQNVT